MQKNFDIVIQDTLLAIKHKYNIVGNPFFLSQLKKSNGKDLLYKFLLSNKKTVFQPADRLILVQDCSDTYEYECDEDTPGQTLIIIQQMLDEIDITNCFVLLVTGNPYVESEVRSVQKLYSICDTVIEAYHINIDYKKTLLSGQDTFCVMPWVHLFNSTDGQVYPCCVADNGLSYGNLVNESVDEIINNSQFKNIRKKMLASKKIRSCQNCYNREENAQPSLRQHKNNKYKSLIEYFKTNTSEEGLINIDSIQELHLGLNNNCNLMCRTCSGQGSSRLAKEEKKLYGYSDEFIRMIDVTDRPRVVDNIKPCLQFAKTINFAGGEPSLQKEQYDILDYLILNNKTDTILNYTLNFTNLQLGQKNLLQYLSKFSNVNITASIDGMDAKFEYIRSGASWNSVLQNFLLVKNNYPHIDLTVNSVVSFLSLESIISLQRFWHTKKILDINKFELNLMYENSGYFDLQTLPILHKKRLAECVKNHCQWLDNIGADSLSMKWQSIKEYMFGKEKTYILKNLKQDIEMKDKNRGTDFFKTFPEFANLFDDV